MNRHCVERVAVCTEFTHGGYDIDCCTIVFVQNHTALRWQPYVFTVAGYKIERMV